MLHCFEQFYNKIDNEYGIGRIDQGALHGYGKYIDEEGTNTQDGLFDLDQHIPQNKLDVKENDGINYNVSSYMGNKIDWDKYSKSIHLSKQY